MWAGRKTGKLPPKHRAHAHRQNVLIAKASSTILVPSKITKSSCEYHVVVGDRSTVGKPKLNYFLGDEGMNDE